MGSARKPIVGGNWKSNPATTDKVNELVTAFNAVEVSQEKVDVVIAPTFLHIGTTKASFQAGIKVAAQNCSKSDEGAFTGEVTAGMIKDIGRKICKKNYT